MSIINKLSLLIFENMLFQNQQIFNRSSLQNGKTTKVDLKIQYFREFYYLKNAKSRLKSKKELQQHLSNIFNNQVILTKH